MTLPCETQGFPPYSPPCATDRHEDCDGYVVTGEARRAFCACPCHTARDCPGTCDNTGWLKWCPSWPDQCGGCEWRPCPDCNPNGTTKRKED